MVSYEIALGLAVVGMVLVYGTLKLNLMVAGQEGSLFQWGLFQAPLAFLIYMVATYAETNRVPFDLVEADSEIVAGFHTEYSSLRFGLFYMGEYVHMAVSAVLTVILFFGGYHVPWAHTLFGTTPYATLFPWVMAALAALCLALAWDTSRPKRRALTQGNMIFAAILVAVAGGALLLATLYGLFYDVAWFAALCSMVTQVAVLVVKFLFFFWLFIWVRWTVPRFRYDQLMKLGWKVMLPLALFNIGLTSVLVLAGWL